METKVRYSIWGELHNCINGGYAYLGANDHFESIDDAKKKFHSYLSTYIGTNDFDRVSVMIIDSFGNVIDREYWSKAIEVETETEEVIE